MKELSLYLFLCHSLRSGTVRLGIVTEAFGDYWDAAGTWLQVPSEQLISLALHLAQAPSSRWAGRASPREWLSKIKHPINSGRGCQCRKNTLRAHRKRPGYAALLMSWNPNHTKPWTSTPGCDMEVCWFHPGVYSRATEAQVGLANYYKFMLKRALGAAFICTIVQKVLF